MKTIFLLLIFSSLLSICCAQINCDKPLYIYKKTLVDSHVNKNEQMVQINWKTFTEEPAYYQVEFIANGKMQILFTTENSMIFKVNKKENNCFRARTICQDTFRKTITTSAYTKDFCLRFGEVKKKKKEVPGWIHLGSSVLGFVLSVAIVKYVNQ